ncbi:MAG: hypothetical protein CMJ83_04840 [Planctomycetes bacterium]|nr:hypothetical protein [Planctomycetota bacterium]
MSVDVPGLGGPLAPPVLGASYQGADENGRLKKSGYFLQVHLPADPKVRSERWCAYAWPFARPDRALYVDWRGAILQTHEGEYFGEKGPGRSAAFSQSDGWERPVEITGGVGSDGRSWRPVF